MQDCPVGVEVWRGARVESRHRVHLAIVDYNGKVSTRIGDIETAVYPRSAIKPLQALPLVASGAADAFAVSDAELALACASHGGEPMHTVPVEAWLERLGLRPDDLACGAHPPSNRDAARALRLAGDRPGRQHNNCSGKHTGMLTLARHLGAPVAGYEKADHAVQKEVARTLGLMTGLDRLEPPGIDGCSLPNWPIPLEALARAMARLAAPVGLPEPVAAAARRIVLAMRAHPELVAGTGRCCTAVMRSLPNVIAKTGAEGVFAAALADEGLGVALKVEDGAGRASEVALIAVLGFLGRIDAEAARKLRAFALPELVNFAGLRVGRLAPAAGWPGDQGFAR